MAQRRTCPPRAWSLLLLALLGLPVRALAQAEEVGTPTVVVAPGTEVGGVGAHPAFLEPRRPALGLLPSVASVGPGLLLHGLGPLMAGDVQTATRLFALEGAGLGLLVAGGVPIALSGASRRVIGPLYLVTMTGVGLFSVSALSNLYGVVAPAFPPGVAPWRLPPLELEVGYQHVAEEIYDSPHFLSLGALARLERVRVEAGAWVAPGNGNLRVRLGGAYRVLGAPEAAQAGADGSALDVEAAALAHRFATEGFTLGGGELFVRGRLAMSRVSPRLEGSFAELGMGVSMQGYGYDGPVRDDSLHEQLLFNVGYGVYLGRGGPFRGEALLYYDHRKDDFAGGLRDGTGVTGFLGLRGRVLLDEHWGVSADVQRGSAWVGRVALVYALGGGL